MLVQHLREKELLRLVGAAVTAGGGGAAARAASAFAWVASSQMTSSTVGLQQQHSGWSQRAQVTPWHVLMQLLLSRIVFAATWCPMHTRQRQTI